MQDQPARLADKLYAVVDLVTQLPVKIWLEENPFLNGTVVWNPLLQLSATGVLLIFDRGFYDYTQFAALVDKGAAWITRLKHNASYRVLETPGLFQGQCRKTKLSSVVTWLHSYELDRTPATNPRVSRRSRSTP